MQTDSNNTPVDLKQHLQFTAWGLLLLMGVYLLLRLALLVYNRGQIGDASSAMLFEAFGNGLRFDLRLSVFACLPLLLALPSRKAMAARGFFCLLLSFFASVTLFLGLI